MEEEIVIEVDETDEAEPSQQGSTWDSVRTQVLVTAAIESWQRTHHLPMFPTYVWNGQSCQEASLDRNQAIADHLQGLIDAEVLDLRGHTIQVGAVTGYHVPGSGWAYGLPENISTHTYSVVQIRDANGNHVASIEVDTYFSNHKLPHSEVDFSDQQISSEDERRTIDVK